MPAWTYASTATGNGRIAHLRHGVTEEEVAEVLANPADELSGRGDAPPQTAPMMKRKNEFSPGWDEQRVRAVLEHYESQTDEEAAAEHEAALSRPDCTLMPIPHELVPKVHQLLAEHEGKRAS